jgi:multiple antibiotic resistance protein
MMMGSIGNIPILSSMLKNYSNKEKIKILIRENILAGIVYVLFVFLGCHIITESVKPYLLLVGSFVLLWIALKMILPEKFEKGLKKESKSIFIPIAIPILCGPGSIIYVVNMGCDNMGCDNMVLFMVLIAWFVSMLITTFSSKLSNLINIKYIINVGRIVGIYLVYCAVKMFIDGVYLI